jgi:hypothetical protein
MVAFFRLLDLESSPSSKKERAAQDKGTKERLEDGKGGRLMDPNREIIHILSTRKSD